MKIEVTVCDRCGKRIEEGQGSVLNLARGDKRQTRDLCGLCEDELQEFLQGKPLLVEPRKERARVAGTAELELNEAKRVARVALLAWKEGASPEQLVQALQDVQTGSRRRNG